MTAEREAAVTAALATMRGIVLQDQLEHLLAVAEMGEDPAHVSQGVDAVRAYLAQFGGTQLEQATTAKSVSLLASKGLVPDAVVRSVA